MQVNDAQGGLIRSEVDRAERELRIALQHIPEGEVTTDATRIDHAEKALLKARLELEKFGTTPLMVAAFRGNEAGLEELIERATRTRGELAILESKRKEEEEEEQKRMGYAMAIEADAKLTMKSEMAPLNDIYAKGEHVLSHVKP